MFDFDAYQKNLEKKLEEYKIPHYMHEGVINYIMHGRATGSFLNAVFSNNLAAAVSRGDDNNQHALVNYIKFLHNHGPIGCHGSEGAVDYWKKIGGMHGQMTADHI